ncbi:MAG: hypothetical protein ACLP7J_16910 [Streptosporangiaceae bacterium]
MSRAAVRAPRARATAIISASATAASAISPADGAAPACPARK